MSLFDKLRQTAEKVAREADRAARYVAENGPGFLGAGTAELLAERDWRKARKLVAAGLRDETAREVIALLLPHWRTDGDYAVLVNRLLAQAYLADGQPAAGREHLRHALSLLADVETRRGAETILYEADGLIAEEVELELRVALASLDLAEGRLDECIRGCQQILATDPRTMTAYYLLGSAQLKKGVDESQVSDLFYRALTMGDAATVLEWVRELLPHQLEWFETMAGRR